MPQRAPGLEQRRVPRRGTEALSIAVGCVYVCVKSTCTYMHAHTPQQTKKTHLARDVEGRRRACRLPPPSSFPRHNEMGRRPPERLAQRQRGEGVGGEGRMQRRLALDEDAERDALRPVVVVGRWVGVGVRSGERRGSTALDRDLHTYVSVRSLAAGAQ